MPRFSFHVRKGKFSETCTEAAFESSAAACLEATMVFADLARDVAAELKGVSEWQIEVTDEAGNLIFGLNILAEINPGQIPKTQTAQITPSTARPLIVHPVR
jgi:hypothetical protein